MLGGSYMKYTHANIHNKCASMGVNGHASVDSTCSLDNFQTQAINKARWWQYHAKPGVRGYSITLLCFSGVPVP